NVAIDVEVSGVAMQPFANQVGQVSDGEDVGGAIESYAVIKGQALARFDLIADGRQARIINVNLHVQAPGFRRKISAAQNKKNNTLTYPFMVKKAAPTREKSLGSTSRCS